MKCQRTREFNVLRVPSSQFLMEQFISAPGGTELQGHGSSLAVLSPHNRYILCHPGTGHTAGTACSHPGRSFGPVYNVYIHLR